MAIKFPPQRLLVVQPYIPTYRVPLFGQLHDRLATHEIELTVAAPPPAGEQARRGDSSSIHPWAIQTRAHAISMAGVTVQSYGARGLLRNTDAAILPASATVTDVHAALWLKWRYGLIVGLWGHIDNYVNRPNPLDKVIEKHLFRASDHIFAYTTSGGLFAQQQGVPATSVTVLENTIDTDELERCRDALTPAQLAEFRRTYGLDDRKQVFSVLGGLDNSKRVDLLADVLDELDRRNHDAVFLVAGQGDQEGLLEAACARGQVIKLGYADPSLKVKMAAASIAFVNLGRIGLVAVDALVLKTPLITSSSFRWHAPEFEYLRPGSDVFLIASGTSQLASALQEFDLPKHHAMSAPPQFSAFVDRFESGIATLCSARKRRTGLA